jgi:hypothetical protein
VHVIVYHNVARGPDSRRINFDGYKPGQPLVPVFRYDADPADSGLPGLQVIAEQAFEAFNLPAELLNPRQGELAARYRGRSLRSLSVGDVLRLGDTALACDPAGFREVPGELNEVRVSEHGTHPIDET